MSDSKKESQSSLFLNKDYNVRADAAKKEFIDKFSKEEIFELMWSYRTVLKYFAYEIVHPNDKKRASALLKNAEKAAILSAQERSEKDGKIKNIGEDLERKQLNSKLN